MQIDSVIMQRNGWTELSAYQFWLRALNNLERLVEGTFLEIPQMDARDTVELRMVDGTFIKDITLNIELIG